MKRKLLGLIFTLAAGGFAAAADFGLVLGGTGEYVSDTGGKGPGFTGTVTPWVSAALGKTQSLYVSGKLSVEYEYETGAWAKPLLFELERTELNFRPAQRVYLTLGRQRFTDAGGMIASGLFDGLHGSFGLGAARLTGGVFYTGFLYKKTAEILMNPEDFEAYLRPLDYGDPNSYFASRRLLTVLGAELPDIGSRISLAFSLLAQSDLNGYESPLHSQYLEVRSGFEAADTLRLTLTGIGALTEQGNADPQANFAAAGTAAWDLPGALTDMLQAELRWGSGAVNDRIGPFTPVSGGSQGFVFAPSLPGLMNVRAGYTAGFRRVVSVTAEAACFWRTDRETFNDGELDGASKDRFLGTEIQGSLIWAPQSPIRVNAGAGVFFPGGAFREGAALRWKINGGIIVSL
jgi:hypothetical protein